MSLYNYVCDCGNTLCVYTSYKNYEEHPPCLKCNNLMNRDPDDFKHLFGYVKKGDGEIKLGHLAARNTERTSKDEQTALNIKHNEYKYKEPEHDLPKGMKRLGNPIDRTIPTKQRKKDPKRRKI